MLRLFLIIVLLSACESLSPDEIEWRRQIDNENWLLCQQVFKQGNAYTVTSHEHRRHRAHRPHEVKEDLADNFCRTNLKEYWIEY